MKGAALFLIRSYRALISPFLGRHCRFEPSCSAYAESAVSSKGIFHGVRLSFLRLMKCHPFHPGGFDPCE